MGSDGTPAAAALVRTAIEAAVHSRLGDTATITVDLNSPVRLPAAGPHVFAIPDPSARIGRPSRFVLADSARAGSPVRLGEVTATVNVTADVVRTLRPVGRGAELAAADVTLAPTDLAGRPLRALPTLEEALAAKTTRELGPDMAVTRAEIVPRLLVRTGDSVRALLRLPEVELSGSVVAVDSGRRNEIVRVVNQGTHRVLRARVVGSGEVEVVNVR